MDSEDQPDMLDFSDTADGLARTTSNVSSSSDLHQRGHPGTSPPPLHYLGHASDEAISSAHTIAQRDNSCDSKIPTMQIA